MVPLPLLFLFAASVSAQEAYGSRDNLPSVTREEDNLDDSIIEIFNLCKCVIFYQCDEQNFIIPQEELARTRVTHNDSLRTINRIRCSNNYYYCCKNKTEAFTTLSTVVPPYMRATPRPLSKVCGIQSGRARRTVDKFPWTVAIYTKSRRDNKYSFKCGGSLIHPRVVMTQRKCVHSSTADELGVVIGQDFLSQDFKLSVSKKIEHESFYSGGNYNDIALIILESPISNVNPICLPNSNQNFDGMRCTAVGWSGRSMYGVKLRKVELPIVNSQSCEHLLKNVSSLSPDFQVHSSFICAGGEEGRATCTGDEGGPLMCKENGRYVQAGIVSWGVECGRKDVPSLYTNVAHLVPWITQKLMAEYL